jgi:hypothetical protein
LFNRELALSITVGGEQLVENFRRNFLKSRRASVVIARNKPEAWSSQSRDSVPHDQVVVSRTGELCPDFVRE